MVKRSWFGLLCNYDFSRKRFGILMVKGGRGGIFEVLSKMGYFLKGIVIYEDSIWFLV